MTRDIELKTLEEQKQTANKAVLQRKLAVLWWNSFVNWQTLLAALLLATTGRLAVSLVFTTGLHTISITGVFALAGIIGLGVILVAECLYTLYTNFKTQYETEYYQKLAQGEDIGNFAERYPSINENLKTLRKITLVHYPIRTIIGAFSIAVIAGVAGFEMLMVSMAIGASLGIFVTSLAESQKQQRLAIQAQLETDQEKIHRGEEVDLKHAAYQQNDAVIWRAMSRGEALLAFVFALALTVRPAAFPLFSDNAAWLHSATALGIIIPLTAIFFIMDFANAYCKNLEQEYNNMVLRNQNLVALGLKLPSEVELRPFAEAHPTAFKFAAGLKTSVESLYVAFSFVFTTLIVLMLSSSLGVPVLEGGLFSGLGDTGMQLLRVCVLAGGLGLTAGYLSSVAKAEQAEALTQAKTDYNFSREKITGEANQFGQTKMEPSFEVSENAEAKKGLASMLYTPAGTKRVVDPEWGYEMDNLAANRAAARV